MTAATELKTRQSGLIWVVTDGRAGNENPALGLAEQVKKRLKAQGEEPEIAVHRLQLKQWATYLPAPVWPLLGTAAEGWPFSALEDGDELGRAAADPDQRPSLAISAGRRSAPIVSALGVLSKGATKTVQLLDPKMGAGRFDLTISPAHDGVTGDGRLSTVGSLNRIDHGAPPAPDARLPEPDAAGGPKIAVLVGGKSKSASFGEAEINALLKALRALGKHGAVLAATVSRRTPQHEAARIEEVVSSYGGFFWNGAGENPYLPMLFWADALIVTADSVNMTSEACALGKPVYVAPAEHLAGKFEKFHAGLRRGGHTRPLEELSSLSELREWSPEPLNDMKAATDAVLELLDESK